MNTKALTYKEFENMYGAYQKDNKTRADHLFFTSSILNERLISIGAAQSFVTNEKSLIYLIYGATRRLFMIKTSFTELIEVAPIERTAALSDDEVSTIEIHLNSILINIFGLIDCLLWTTLYHSDVDPEPFEKSPMKVRFNKSFFQKIELGSKKTSSLLNFDAWLTDFKSKRNSSAHKIPYYVPPSSIEESERQKYIELNEQLGRAMLDIDVDEHEKICKELEELGTFCPMFAQDPFQKPYAIYPTIPDDICQLLNLIQVFVDHFKGP